MHDNVHVLTVVATDANASEGGSDAGTFTITRTGDPALALNVSYSLSGSATNGVDFATLNGSVTIPAGATSTTVTVTPINDVDDEGNETVVLTLTDTLNYVLGSPSEATVTIQDNVHVLTVVATDANASEAGSDPGTFTITRTGDPALALNVSYSLGGSATNGVDFNTLNGSVTFPAGAPSTTVTVTPINDATPEGPETVILTLTDTTNYVLGSPNSATVTIADQLEINIVATDPNAAEGGSDPAVFTISRSGATTFDRDVAVTVSGTA